MSTDATSTEVRPPIPAREEPSLAFRCPQCQFDKPETEEAETGNNPSPDRWFHCPSCGYRWNVSPISDS